MTFYPEKLCKWLYLMINRNRVALYDAPEIPSHVQIQIQPPGMVPLLALLPNSLDDVALAHALILHIHELCAKVPGLLRNYNSVGLFEALCKTLSVLGHLKQQTTDVCGQDTREILFQVWSLTQYSPFYQAFLTAYKTSHV